MDKPNLEALPMVCVHWIDSFGGVSTDWTDIDDCEQSITHCISVGYLRREDSDCVVLVPHIALEHRGGCGDVTIPIVAIQGIWNLEKVNERKR